MANFDAEAIEWISTNSTKVGELVYGGKMDEAKKLCLRILKRYPTRKAMDCIITASALLFVGICGVPKPEPGKFYGIRFEDNDGNMINPDDYPEMAVTATTMRIINAVSNADDEMVFAFLDSIPDPGFAGEVLGMIFHQLESAGGHHRDG